jgi:hypothetical protein
MRCIAHFYNSEAMSLLELRKKKNKNSIWKTADFLTSSKIRKILPHFNHTSQHPLIFGISEQFPIRKSTISIYRATSMRIFNLGGLGAPDKPEKKNKFVEIDFTSHHSFLRVRRDQFLQNCKKNPPLSHSIRIL